MRQMIICIAVALLASACSANQTPDQAQPERNEAIRSTPSPNQLNQPVPQDNKQSAGKTDKVLLDVAIIAQNPELKYGCEVTSLTMLLNHAGVHVDKMKLAEELPKDMDPQVKTKTGNITHWGNPENGFVGDITGKKSGYAVFDKPLEKLMRRYLPDRTVNLTGEPFADLLEQLRTGRPVVVWTTGDYKLPDRWEAWKHGNEIIKTPLDLHAVVLVGFDRNHVYVNDPLSGKKAHQVDMQTFKASWDALGKQALSYN